MSVSERYSVVTTGTTKKHNTSTLAGSKNPSGVAYFLTGPVGLERSIR
jgi:hypothetical protein